MNTEKNNHLSFKKKLYLVDKEPLTADIGIKGSLALGLNQKEIDTRLRHGYVNLIPGVHKKMWYEDLLCCTVRPSTHYEYTKLIHKHLSDKSTVIRNGKTEKIPREKLIPGDVVILERGSKANADIELLEITEPLKICIDLYNGSSEDYPKQIMSEPMEKPWNRPNIILTGSSIVQGSAKGVVIAVGEQTIIGKIMKEINRRSLGSKKDHKDSATPVSYSPFGKYDDRIKEQNTTSETSPSSFMMKFD